MNTPEQDANFNSIRVWLDRHHDRLAGLARAGYARDGRGCLLATATTVEGATTRADWFALQDIVRDPATDHVVRMVEDYNPDAQFVVVCDLANAKESVSAKIRLRKIEGQSGALH